MRYNSRVDICRLLAEWYDTKSNVKLGGFQSQLEVSYVYSHTEELWYNETICQWMILYLYIYIYIYMESFTDRLFRCITTLQYDYRDIYTPLPPWGWVLWRRSNRVAISVYCKPLRRWIEVSMYVNNSNCDS